MTDRIKDKKKQLEDASLTYQKSLSKDIDELSDTAVDWVGKILSVGGGVLAAYLAFKMFFGGGKDDKSVKEDKGYMHTDFKQMFLRSLSDKAAVILLELLREYLMKMMDKMDEDE